MRTLARTILILFAIAVLAVAGSTVVCVAVLHGQEDGAIGTRVVAASTSGTQTFDGIRIVNAVDSIDKVYDGKDAWLSCRVTVGSQVSRLQYAWYKDGQCIDRDADGMRGIRTVADSGEYRLHVTAFYADGSNETAYSDPMRVTIHKARYDLSALRFEDTQIAYDGAAHGITASGVPQGVHVSYSAPQTQIGTYTITATFAGDADNYEPIPSMTATLYICTPVLTYTMADGSVISARNPQGFLPGYTLSVGQVEDFPVSAFDPGNLFGSRRFRQVHMLSIRDAQGNAVAPASGTEICWSGEGAESLYYSDGMQLTAAEQDAWVSWQGTGYLLYADTVIASGQVLLIGLLVVLAGLLLAIGGVEIALRRHSAHVSASARNIGFAAVIWNVVTPAQTAWAVVLGVCIVIATCVLIGKIRRLVRLLHAREVQADAFYVPPTLLADPDDTEVLWESEQELMPVRQLRAFDASHVASLPAPDVRYLPCVQQESKRQQECRLHYRYSFSARLIQSDERCQRRYGYLRDRLLAGKKVHMRIGWEGVRFSLGRNTLARMRIRGKTLYLYLALAPQACPPSRYRIADVGEKDRYADTPVLLRVRSDGAMRYAAGLIAQLLQSVGVGESPVREHPYSHAYQTRSELFARGLVKCYLRWSDGENEHARDLAKWMDRVSDSPVDAMQNALPTVEDRHSDAS